MALGNAGTNQSEGGRTPSSAYGEAFKRAANRGRTMLRMAPQMQPPLPAEGQGVGGYNVAPGSASGSGAVREARATVYHAFDPQLSGTMLYMDYFGTMASRGHKPAPIVRLRGYMGELPMDQQPKLTKAYPWNDPTAGLP